MGNEGQDVSHKATQWLSEIDPAKLGNAEFRVLFHLCDCHNPSAGCFPTQAYLIGRCGVSNGTVNNALNALESKGLIQRHRERDGRSKRQKPTRYILGFEFAKPQGPTPDIGDGKGREPTPETGDGAVSNLRGEPTPISGVSRLQPTGEKPVKKPVINQRACASGQKKVNPMVAKAAVDALTAWRSGRADALDGLKPWVVAHLRGSELLTTAERARLGWADAEKGQSDD